MDNASALTVNYRRQRDALERVDWRWLSAALLAGGILRVLVLAIGPLSVGDGTTRLLFAIAWAHAPRWEGLSGVWPPFHWYIFGSLIRLWPDPLFWSFSLGLLSQLGTIYLMYRAAKCFYGDVRVAGWSAFLLAVYWIHASLVGSNFVEVYYLFFVTLAIYWTAVETSDLRPGNEWYALGCGLAMAVALLLRHEAKLLWPIFVIYLWWHGSIRSALLFCVPSFVVLAWQLLEPSLMGHSYAQWTKEITEMKAIDQQLSHQSLVDALKRWILMPSGTPSFIVVGLGVAGLWIRRTSWKRELFVMLFLVQAGAYFTMTLVAGWKPQQRYIMLYFINLLPYAAVAMAALHRRIRWLPATLAIAAVLIQGGTWAFARGNPLPLGFLPVQMLSTSQIELERWMRTVPSDTRIYQIAAYALRSHAFRTVAIP